MRKLLLVFLLFVLLITAGSVEVWAQQEEPSEKVPWSFGANGYYGAIFGYRRGLDKINFTHPVGVEVFAHRHTLGKRNWEKKYKYPNLGFGLSYYNYGLPEELGEAVSLTTYLDNRIKDFGKSSLRFNVGTGLVYSTRYFSTEHNPLNKAIGSKFTFALRATLRYEFPVYPKVYMNLNLAFRHFSNGSLNQVNNGMNMPLVGMGVRYQLREASVREEESLPKVEVEKKVRINLRFSAGMKEVLMEDTKHPVYTISAYTSKRLTQTNTVLIGLDAIYDTGIREEYINQHLPAPEGELDLMMAGITLGHELHMGALSFVFQLGRYIYEPHELFPGFYQRYGLQYMLGKNLSANTVLLVHGGNADVLQLGLGFHL